MAGDLGTLEERFWARVDRNGPVHAKLGTACWVWLGPPSSGRQGGYGSVKWKGQMRRAHRVSYMLTYGDIPERAVVMHVCDRRLCVRPDHLRAGTQRENMEDAAKKGRMAHPRGELQGRARLTWAAVAQIRAAIAAGESQRDLARRFAVHESTVCGIKHNRRWVV